MSKMKRSVRTTDHIAVITASLFDVSPRYVQMIRDGQRLNPGIDSTYKKLKRDIDQVIRTARESIIQKN